MITLSANYINKIISPIKSCKKNKNASIYLNNKNFNST